MCRVYQALDGAPVTLYIDEQGCGDLIPVPRVIPMVLMMAFDFASISVQSEHRRGIEVIPSMHIARPRRSVARAPVGQVELRIEVASNPDRYPTSFPRLLGPGIVARFSRAWNRIGLPHLLPGLGIEGCNETTHPEFTTRGPNHHFALCHKWC